MHKQLNIHIRAFSPLLFLKALPVCSSVKIHDAFDVFSTSLMSCQNKVCQSLARLIQWTDGLLVGPREAFSKESAHEIIDTLAAGIKVVAYAC